MRNYIEHDIRVKYIDGLLSQSQDWEWFICYVEDNYDLEDVISWDEFRTKYNRLSEVYSSFIKIIEIIDTSLKSNSVLLSDLLSIASFFIGRIDKRKCSKAISTSFGRLMFFIVLITKLENSINETNHIADFSLFIYANYWRLIDSESTDLFEEELDYVSGISIVGWAEVEKTFRDNINKVSYKLSDDFFDRFGSFLYNVNAFNYQAIATDKCCTWEERFLLDMIYTSIDGDELKPAIVFNGNEHPDQRRWTKEVLEHMQSFFNNKKANLIIETIGYYLYGDAPSNEVIIDHFNLLNTFIDHSSCDDMIRTSSFKIVARLCRNREINDLVKKDDSFISLMKKINDIKDPVTIQQIKDAGFYVSKEQKKLLRIAAENYFNNLDDVNELSKLSTLLQNRAETQYLTSNQLESINNIFIDLVDAEEDTILIASVFYEYMCFLLEVYCKSVSVDKRKLHQFMINTQLLWEMEHFERQTVKMHTHNFDMSIRKEEIKHFNELALISPIIVANTVAMAKGDEICSVMKNISENPLIYFVTHFNINSSFPVKSGKINYSRHEVDGLLNNHVHWIIQEKGYKFLNVLDEDKYVRGILEQFRIRVDTTVSMLIDESRFYKKVEDCCDIKLIDYNSNLKLAHLAQLFPLLEMKIRELAKNEGYFPFKKDVSEFMQYNDPSSVLREIIIDSCEELHGFDPVADLYFIYNCMYNANSLNIRNEVIHGRGFLSQNGLHYALRITMICILMVEQRLQIIFRNRRNKLKQC